ncbi:MULTISPECIES: hypothetical protein [unclassified Rathayibacter]|uniref:hypothetical protein n=1 Tax=unclassified Rathayibacter TaxID=2609250 RepID=UPI000CE8820D|nr:MULTISPECIES: hypothetical protein [unclassified Rathayibacter]PPF18319.1 hypothetical protein C5B95_11990 [Rathayibacter sp. AY1A7]PPF34387.1 hypothetical protein C5C10_09300 [Rathayibacter sp. AY1A3]
MTADEFNEADDPSRDPVPVSSLGPKAPIKALKPKRWKHDADTRRGLAIGIVGSTVVIYAGLVFAVIIDALSVESSIKLVAALAPLQSLAAVTVGFFFARRDRGR